MSDYSAVAPPTNLNFDPSSAFADALQRARQIAAKINPLGTNSDGEAPSLKRPAEDPSAFGAQLAAMHQQQRTVNGIMNEDFKVPDKMVGLIIGRGGEQITKLQSESGCKVQIAADSAGQADRSCTLTGTRQAIEKAKELIQRIVERGQGAPGMGTEVNVIMPDGPSTIEMMIPGNKVGLVIGKGGETIKTLQERAGVKMVMIQDGPQQTAMEKPLRISGDPPRCEHARQLVEELIVEKDMENMNEGFIGMNDIGGSEQTVNNEVPVPRSAVGVVIGKGGDMIKKIQQKSGARVQFKPDEGDGGDRICIVSGYGEQISIACSMIIDLINSVTARDQQQGAFGRGRGRGRGRGDGGNRNDFGAPRPGGPPGAGGGGRFNQGDMPEITFSVPANKCGLVIGKGGETIRLINQQSGAHVELSRHTPPNPTEKIFVLRGNPQQIHHAQQLINEKVSGGPGGPGGPGNFNPQSNGQNAPQPQGFAPQGWGNAYHHWQNQPTQNDPSKQAADANAAWAAYYAQYYGQGQQQPPHTAQPPQQQPPAQATPAQTQAQSTTTPTAATTTAGGQPDYSAAWADYYRSLGMHQQADMIEQQARANQQSQQPSTPAAAPYAQPAQPQPYAQYSQPNQYQQPPAGQYPQAQQQFPPQGQYGQQFGQPAPPQQYNYGQ